MSDYILLGIKTKLNLTNAQKVLMAKHAGIARFTFNWGLAVWQDFYKSGCKFSYRTLRTFFNKYVKKEYKWIKEKGICQKITEFAFENLNNAFLKFFKATAGYPKFKKKGQNDSFTINSGGKPIPFGGKSIKLPTIGWVKLYEDLPDGTTRKITISRIANDWYISFNYYRKKPEVSPNRITSVGVDLGINTLATLSTTFTFKNAKYLDKNLNKLAKLQRKLARKAYGSNNRKKAKIQLQRLYSRIAFLRKDLLHKITTYICQNHATIVVEAKVTTGILPVAHFAI